MSTAHQPMADLDGAEAGLRAPTRRGAGWIPRLAVIVALAALPLLPVRVPLLFTGSLDAPGTLNLLGLMLVFGTVALTYDLLFGYTGLLSFGHALYFAVGVYTVTIAMVHGGLDFVPAVGVTLVVGAVVALVLGAVSLRVGGIAFAMVTLAFAQAGHIFVLRDPMRITGGEEGLAVPFRQIPEFLAGVANTRNVYWVSLALAVIVYAAARWFVRSRPGRVLEAIRENETRVEVLGLRAYPFKLMAFVTSSIMATLAGAVYVLLVRGAHPHVTAATFTLTLLVMVVLGGTGTLWGAMLGGSVYYYLNHRLIRLSGSDAVSDLPGVLSSPLSEPLFILGTIFVLLVLFFPGGLAGLRTTRVGVRLAQALRSPRRDPVANGE